MDLKDAGRRSSVRVKARLKVRFKNTESFINEYTYNISKGGIFIRTNHPCALREKVEVFLILPGTQQEIVALGEVIHLVGPEQATEHTPAGMGIQILEIKPEDQNRIEEFIKKQIKTSSDVLGRREHPRLEAKVRVKFESKEALVEEYIHNISHGGIFITTNKPAKIHDQIGIILIHPENNQELFLQGEVVRVLSSEDAERLGTVPGMGIKFLKMDTYVKKQIDDFIRSETVKQAGKNLIIEEEKE